MPKSMVQILMLVLLLFCLSIPVASAAENESEIEVAWDSIISALAGGSAARPFGGADELLLWVDDGQGGSNSLTALVEQAGQAALERPGLFKKVVSARKIFSGSADLSQQGLAAIDRRGFDRLLKVDACSSSGAVIIKVTAWWLDSDVWSLMAGRPYYARQTEARLPASPLWGMLENRALDFGPSAPAWNERELFTSDGRVLDMAAADLDVDGSAELVLLLEERLEVWGRSGEDDFSFRYMQSLPKEELTLPARYAVGSLSFCNDGAKHAPVLLLAHNRLPGGWMLQWSGADFAITTRLERAPLACLPSASGADAAVISAAYVSGSTAFNNRLYTGGSGLRREYKMPEAFVAFEAAPTATDLRDIYAVSVNGSVYDGLGGKALPAGSCGTQPAIAPGPAAENVLACGAARFGSSEEGLSIVAVTQGASSTSVGYFPAAAGSIAAICAAAGEGLRFYVARYDSDKKSSRVMLLYP